MNHLLPQRMQFHLDLADGSHWGIVAGDEKAEPMVSQLANAMQLRMTTSEIEPSSHGNLRLLLVQTDAHTSVEDCFVPSASKNDVVVCVLSRCDYYGGLYVNLVRLSHSFAREAQARGGVLVHGALAEREGVGVILAAPGGTGKTTASNRLPASWRSLCDDTTLIVRDLQGNYWAHPWPTWSRFLDGGPGGTWEVQNAVPVRGIFFLVQAAEDWAERVGSGQTACLLGESVGQVSTFMAPGLSKQELCARHLERFNNVCILARVVPAHLLHISLTGSFWQEIEQAL
ncbi:MAG: SynChlorMet cassette protein ScmC [Anaerolineae bacterium]